MINYDDTYIKNRQGIPIATYACALQSGTPPYIAHLHYHKDFELLYIDEGCADLLISGKHITASQNSLILINPFEPHYIESKTPNFAHRCIDFDLSILSLPEEGAVFSGELHYRNHIHDGSVLRPYFDLCYIAETTKEPGWTMRAKGGLLILFSLLGEYLDSSGWATDSLFAKRVLDILEQRYSHPLTSRMLADELSYNNSYFCRLFKKNFACCFSEYLNLFRISKAKLLLPDHSVSQTAILTGYSSASYFSSAFRAATGITPKQYRQSIDI